MSPKIQQMIAYLWCEKRQQRQQHSGSDGNSTLAVAERSQKERLIRYFARKFILIKWRHMIFFPVTTRVQTMQTNCLVPHTRTFLQLKIMLCRTALGTCTRAYICILFSLN